MRQRLEDAQSRASALTSELQQAKSQRDSIRRQVKDKTEEQNELLRQVRREQEATRTLDSQVVRAGEERRSLELRARVECSEKLTAELLVQELQLKLRELEQAAAAAQAQRGDAQSSASSLDTNLQKIEKLRRRVEDTVRWVCKTTAMSEASGGMSATASGDGLRLQVHGPSSQASTSLLESASPCSSTAEVGMGRAASLDTEDPEGAEDGPFSDPKCRTRSAASASQAGRSREPADSAAAAAHSPVPPMPVSTHRGSGTCALFLRDLSELKALKKPPPPLRMLMEICCVLFHIQPVKQADARTPRRSSYDYWEPARRYLLSDPFFLSKLRMYGAETIAPSDRAKIRRYFADPEFSADRVRSCSKAAYDLYEWVKALVEPDPPALPAADAAP